jgi:hypothetical protein
MPVRRLILALALFAFGVVAAATLGVGLTYWVDPEKQRYDASILDRALATDPAPCLMTSDVIGDSPAIAGFKLDLLRTRRPRTVVIGLSRSLEIRAWPGEEGFVNLSTPGLAPDSLPGLIERIRKEAPGPKTVYLGIEPVWLSPVWAGFLAYDRSLSTRVRRYVSSDGLVASAKQVARHGPPGPPSLASGRLRGRCVLHATDEPPTFPLWDVDGSIRWNEDGERAIQGRDGGQQFFTGIDPQRIAALAAALQRMRGLGWEVVGFTPPLAPSSLARMLRSDRMGEMMGTFQRIALDLHTAAGFAYVDGLDRPRAFGCTDENYAAGDAWHPDAACSRAIRRELDRVAASR